MDSSTSRDEDPLLRHDATEDDSGGSSESDFELEELRNDIDKIPLRAVSSGNAKYRHDTDQRDRKPSRRKRCWPRRRCLIFGTIITIALLLAAAFGWRKYTQRPRDGQSPPWYPSPKGGTVRQWAGSYEKAAILVSQMTLAEKVNITTGTGWSMGLAVGNTGPAVHTGFPSLALQDGPLGIRFADNATAFPAGITVGASWNKHLMYERGKAHGMEAREKGINVVLGPSVGPLGRMPAGGRNWEGFGPDPYLQGVAAEETIKGIQGQGVMATIKHFVANEQEHFRQPWAWGLPHAVSSNIDDRTMHELYAWPFANAVKAGVASVMCSYNMVNNSYACGNSKLLNGILKDELGFQGFIMSDWLAQQSGVASALAGLDMTMPGDGLGWQDGNSLWGPHLTRAVLNESLPLERLNDMVVRVVAAWYQLGQDDKSQFSGDGPNFSSWTNEKMGLISPGSSSPQDLVEVNKFVHVHRNHSILTRDIAMEGTVLLKNNGILPLDRAGRSETWHSKRDEDKKVLVSIFGEDAGPGQGPNHCDDRGCNQGTLGSGWGSGAVEFPYLITPEEALKNAFDPEKVKLSTFLHNEKLKGNEPEHSDICIVFANSDAGEGYLKWESVAGDRNDLYLQKGGEELVRDVATRCGGGDGSTIVVVHAVGPVVMERWIDLPGIGAVLAANLPGQESGNAISSILLGDVNPSGKLPYTVGKSLKDYGPGGQILYRPNGAVPQQNFDEGLYVDYRYFDKNEIEPRFEFGFGLSYTNFTYTNLKIMKVKPRSRMPEKRPADGPKPPVLDDKLPSVEEAIYPKGLHKLKGYVYPYIDSASEIKTGAYPYPDGYHIEQPLSDAGGDEGGNPDLWATYVEVSIDVENTGKRGGKEIPQLYVSHPKDEGVDFPERVLRGFEKAYINSGEKKTFHFHLTRRDLSYWDVELQNWVIPDGKFIVAVGSSSRKLWAKETM